MSLVLEFLSLVMVSNKMSHLHQAELHLRVHAIEEDKDAQNGLLHLKLRSKSTILAKRLLG